MNRKLITERCKQLGLDPHTVARQVCVDPFFLVDTDSRRADDGLPLSVLRHLSRLLDLSLDELVDAPTQPVEEPGDDIRLEAAFGLVNTLCRDDIAQAFGWTPGRVERALAVLEVRLRSTGRRLHHTEWHRYSLGPNKPVLSTGERAQLQDGRRCGGYLWREEAEVLRLVISGWTEKRTWNRPQGQISLTMLLVSGLLDDKGAYVATSDDVRFSLRLDEGDQEPTGGNRWRTAPSDRRPTSG